MPIKWFKKKKEKEEKETNIGAEKKKQEEVKEDKKILDDDILNKVSLKEKINIEPIITEKTRELINKYNTYTFKVTPPSFNKNFIKHFIEKKFNVKILDIRTINYKKRRRGKTKIPSVRNRFKKVYIKLPQEQKIDIFD